MEILIQSAIANLPGAFLTVTVSFVVLVGMLVGSFWAIGKAFGR